jgi:hypothetical protein
MKTLQQWAHHYLMGQYDPCQEMICVYIPVYTITFVWLDNVAETFDLHL